MKISGKIFSHIPTHLNLIIPHIVRGDTPPSLTGGRGGYIYRGR